MEVNASGSLLEPGALKELFDSGTVNNPAHLEYHRFAVSPDGQRFLIPRPASNVTAEDGGSSPIAVVINWTVALKK